jgi:hypothetical protein
MTGSIVTAVIQSGMRTRAEGRLIPMQKRWVSRSIVVMAAVVATLLPGVWTGRASAVAVSRQAPTRTTSADQVGPAPQAVSFSRLNAVSCATSSLCMAVGFFGPTVPKIRPYTEMWNGKTWRVLSVRGPVHAHQLTAVSCASRSSCVAVGLAGPSKPYAQAWNGRSWRVLTMPSQQATLHGISCSSVTSCMAVGGDGVNTAADEWNGKTWRVLTMPAVPAALSIKLVSVSCASSKNCLAVGSYTSSSSGNPVVALAEAWDGTAWTLLANPAADPAGSVLSGVSCGSAFSCVAVGFNGPQVGGTDTLLAESWDGHNFTALPAVTPPGAGYSVLSSISCTSGTSCMAVGDYAVPADLTGMAETWNGSTWALTKTPASFAVGPVSCGTAASCVDISGTLAEQWNGSSWRTLRTLRFDSLASISCTGRGRCMAVGSRVTASDQAATLAQQWNGRSWRARTSSTPAGSDTFTSISCASPTFCMALTDGSAQHSFAEKWNGRTWSHIKSPPVGVTSVSCPTTTKCIAVGEFNAGAWNGRAWRKLTVAAPKAFTFFLTDISCPTANRCIAVGYKTAIGRGDHVLAEELNGSRWRILATHLLPEGQLDGVDCTRVSRCMAVGGGLAAQWNGRAWRKLRLPGPGGLADVSCSSGHSCLAVGSYALTSDSKPLQVAARWNGRHWAQVRTPLHGGVLSGVSCVRGPRCIAVGQAGGLDTRTVAEVWNGARLSLMHTPNP